MNLIKRFKSAYQHFKILRDGISIDVYNEDLLKASLKRTLKKTDFYPSPNNNIVLEDIVDTAIRAAKSGKDEMRLESASKVYAQIFEDLTLKIGVAGGVSALWEIQLKFFASKLHEVKVLEVARKQKKLRTLNVGLISEAVKKYYPFIKTDLEYVAELRNNLIHGNFHQIRSAILEKDPSKAELLKSKTHIPINIKHPESKIVMPHEITDLDEAKDKGVFFWFVSAGNTKLLDIVIDELSRSLNDVMLLSELKAQSYDELAGMFDKLAREGERLSPQEEDVLYERIKRKLPDLERDKYFAMVYDSFENLKVHSASGVAVRKSHRHTTNKG